MLPIVLIAAVSGGASQAGASPCTPSGVSGIPTTAAGLTLEQLHNAGIIIAVGAAIPNVGQLGEIDALTAAITESGLINVNHGDLDSLGLFQERPSQGWGTPQQIMDPVYSATQFYLHLTALPSWQAMDPASAAQAVERSAFPTRYQANVGLAVQLVTNATPASPGSVVVNNCAPAGVVPIGAGGAGLPAEVVAQIAAAPVQAQMAIAYALAQVGKPYVWGATGPDSFDCSGLTMRAYQAAGVALPRTTYEQVLVGTAVPDMASLRVGDLLLPDSGHVQIVLSNGGGWIVEAPHTGALVRVGPSWGWWAARRIVG